MVNDKNTFEKAVNHLPNESGDAMPEENDYAADKTLPVQSVCGISAADSIISIILEQKRLDQAISGILSGGGQRSQNG